LSYFSNFIQLGNGHLSEKYVNQMGVKCDDTLIKLPISKLIELYYDTHDEPNQKVL
jgi:hypothetical protein